MSMVRKVRVSIFRSSHDDLTLRLLPYINPSLPLRPPHPLALNPFPPTLKFDEMEAPRPAMTTSKQPQAVQMSEYYLLDQKSSQDTDNLFLS